MSNAAQGPRLRSIISGTIGNLVEWYDWYAYAAFSLYFSKAFFPGGDQTAQLLNTAGIFALGFLMRPLGGWLFGWYSDKHGRRAGLTLSVLLMCAGSLLIAITPDYGAIGVAAPVLLLLARLLQGLSVGGEYGASATYLSEMAGERHRGFYSSFQYVTLVSGQLVALGVLIVLQNFVLSPEQLEAWGWRIPFVIGAALAVVALWLRRGMEETPAFENRRREGGLKALLLRHPWACLQVVGLTLGGTVAFYTFTTYMQKFLVVSAGWTKAAATEVSALTLLVFVALQPVFGALSDRIGRRPLLIAFGVGGMLLVVPIMTALSNVTAFWPAFGLILTALVIVSGYTSINAVVKAELFPAEVRAMGVGLPYALAVSVFGGSAEAVALALREGGRESLFFWYVAGCIGVSLMVYIFTPDTRARSAFRED